MDSRPVGRPVCFREIMSDRISPLRLCLNLGVPVPEGYQPYCSGGEDHQGPDDPFRFVHGATVLLWMDVVGPGRSPSVSTVSCELEQDDAQEGSGGNGSSSSGEGCPGPSAQTDATSARSRSPRRRARDPVEMPFSPGSDSLQAAHKHEIITEVWRGGSSVHVDKCLAGTRDVTAIPSCPRPFTTAACTAQPPASLPCAADSHHVQVLGLSAALRGVPTPCRSDMCPPGPSGDVQDMHDEAAAACLDGPLVTLMEAASWVHSSELLSSVVALFDSAELSHAVVVPRGRVPLQLCELVPVSDTQLRVLELLDILDQRAACLPHAPKNWLNADLGPVLASHEASSELKWRVSNVRTCWTPPAPQPVEALQIYTDGSYQPGAAGALGQAAWAFAVWHVSSEGVRYCGHAAYGTVPTGTPYHLGEQIDDSICAEQLAVAWALIWLLDCGVRQHVPVTLAFDCESVGWGAFGYCGQPRAAAEEAGSRLAAFITSLRQCLAPLVEITPVHVRGHAGVLGNEIVDVLSKLATKEHHCPYVRCLPTWPAKLACHVLHPWAWQAFDPGSDLPTLFSVPSEADRLQRLMPDIHVPPKDGQPCQQVAGRLQMKLTVVSFNVLTLLDKTAAPAAPTIVTEEGVLAEVGFRLFGKRDLVKRQFDQIGVHVAGLQETRVPGSQVLADADWWMFHSGCTSQGHFGVALWVHKLRAFASLNAVPVRVCRDHFTVLYSDPRLLIVDYSSRALRLVFVVAHAPHDVPGAGAEASDAFWGRVTSLLQPLPPSAAVILLTDANAHVGECTTMAIGTVAPEPENCAGHSFHNWLLTHDLSAANTFACSHSGPSFTWVSSHGARRRLDFVCVPRTWIASTSTWVLYTLEHLQARDDHFPVVATCDVCKSVSLGAHQPPPQRRAMRPDAQWSPYECFNLQLVLDTMPDVSWSVGVDAHYASWVQQYQAAWGEAAHVAVQQPRQHYLQSSTLCQVQQRQACRQYLAQEGHELRRRILLYGFAAFVHLRAGTRFTPAQVRCIDVWFYEMDVSIARAVALLQRASASIRQMVRRDRVHFLEQLKTQVASQSLKGPKELFRSLRQVFPQARSSRRSGFQPLPQLLLEDGTVARTAEERTRRWGAYFAEMEAGSCVTDTEYQMALTEQQRIGRRTKAGSTVFDWKAMVSLAEVESLVLTSKRRKAVGYDGVSAELLQLDPPRAARRLCPLFMKTTVALYEPVAFRGGSLMTLAKKAGAANLCKDYRSILLAATSGKLYHRALRNRLLPLLQGV